MPETLADARRRDEADPLKGFRSRFFFPTDDHGNELIYLCGNSLGLQPRTVREHLEVELEDWAKLGVEGHFHGRNPWYSYHEIFSEPVAEIVGAKPHEVVVMNGLTTNLHLLMVSFYRPTPQRYKILIEKSAFPSDQYAVASQAKFHGWDPADAIVEFEPREGEETLRTEDIEAWLAENGDDVALVMFGGVNYYTGQAFELKRIAAAAHKAGAMVGFDCAHAAGNVRLQLHDSGADFACWCSYKYLNSGPGSVAGAFVHERHAFDPELPRFAGWWGNDPETRFEMKPEFVPQRGAGGWQLSNAPVFAMAPHKASVEIFAEAGMDRLRAKSVALTTYALDLIDTIPTERFRVITPRDPAHRGCQLSIQVMREGRELFAALQAAGIVCDFREPDVIRIAGAPLYNSFEDIYRFCEILRETT
jgi:kynureninase